jgi:K+-transporting ATPase KdpF subunit
VLLSQEKGDVWISYSLALSAFFSVSPGSSLKESPFFRGVLKTSYWRVAGMTVFYIIGLIVAAGLVVYLFAALLRPELFS